MFASTPHQSQTLRVSGVDGNGSRREALPTGIPQGSSLLPALLALQRRTTGPISEPERSKGGCCAPRELQREDLTGSVSYGGCTAASTPQPAARLPTPGPARQGGEHGAGSPEQVCAPSPLPNSLSAAPVTQTHPGLGPDETSLHSVIANETSSSTASKIKSTAKSR